MSDFIFDFNNLQKQLAFANLTDEQIQQLMATLQAKKSNPFDGLKNVPVELTREEKVFYQCCREHRSYSKNQDIDKVFCSVCGSVEVTKYGKRNGRQRYICKNCGKTFSDTSGTVMYHSKLPIKKWIDFIQMTLQGESCRSIARNLGINKDTVLHNRHRICSVINQLASNQDNFQSLAEGDEYYYPLSFKDVKDPMFFLGTLGRMPFTRRSTSEKWEYVLKQGFSHSFIEQLEENEEYRERQLAYYVDRDVLKSQEKFSNALNQMDTEIIIQVLKTLNEQQKKKRGISNHQVCCLTCVDPYNNHYLDTVCVGRIGAKHIEKHLIPHFSDNTILVTDSHSAYKTAANRNKIPLRQIPSGKHTSGGFNLGLVNGYHHNISDFMYGYHGVSSKFLDYYLSLFYWKEKNKSLSYLEQAYEIMTLLASQANKIPLDKFKEKKLSFDLKGILDNG